MNYIWPLILRRHRITLKWESFCWCYHLVVALATEFWRFIWMSQFKLSLNTELCHDLIFPRVPKPNMYSRIFLWHIIIWHAYLRFSHPKNLSALADFDPHNLGLMRRLRYLKTKWNYFVYLLKKNFALIPQCHMQK